MEKKFIEKNTKFLINFPLNRMPVQEWENFDLPPKIIVDGSPLLQQIETTFDFFLWDRMREMEVWFFKRKKSIYVSLFTHKNIVLQLFGIIHANPKEMVAILDIIYPKLRRINIICNNTKFSYIN